MKQSRRRRLPRSGRASRRRASRPACGRTGEARTRSEGRKGEGRRAENWQGKDQQAENRSARDAFLDQKRADGAEGRQAQAVDARRASVGRRSADARRHRSTAPWTGASIPMGQSKLRRAGKPSFFEASTVKPWLCRAAEARAGSEPRRVGTACRTALRGPSKRPLFSSAHIRITNSRGWPGASGSARRRAAVVRRPRAGRAPSHERIFAHALPHARRRDPALCSRRRARGPNLRGRPMAGRHRNHPLQRLGALCRTGPGL